MPQSGAVRVKPIAKPKSPPGEKRSSAAVHKRLLRLLREGRHKRVAARCEKWLGEFPLDGEIWAVAGSAAIMARDIGKAVNCLSRAVDLAPSKHHNWSQFALALGQDGQKSQAISAMAEAVRLAPAQPGYARQLAALFLRDDLWAEAAQAFDLATQLDPEDRASFAGLARTQYHLGAFVVALKAIDRALHLAPECAQHHDLRGQCLRALWRPEEAKSALRKALVLKPKFARGYLHYADGFGLSEAPDLLAAAEAQLQASPSQTGETYLRFAIGEAKLTAGDFAGAYQQFCQANALHKQHLGYDILREESLVSAIRDSFAKPQLANRGASLPHIPIFVLGLPCSGASLVEIILSCHSDVWAGGEMNHLAKAVQATGGVTAPMTEARAQALRDQYFARVPNPAGARFVTDTLPLNFRLTGFLAEAMPQARIIHVQRAARATGWMLFRNFLAGSANGFACDPDDICRFHALYVDLMGSWQARYGSRIIGLRYEDLVAEPQSQIANLLDALGLPWQADCLLPQRSRYRPRTAPGDPAAQAIQQDNLDEWQDYMPFAKSWMSRLATC